jgi:hypothetical protein
MDISQYPARNPLYMSGLPTPFRMRVWSNTSACTMYNEINEEKHKLVHSINRSLDRESNPVSGLNIDIISPRMWLLFSILWSSTGTQIFVVNERNCTNFVSYCCSIVSCWNFFDILFGLGKISQISRKGPGWSTLHTSAIGNCVHAIRDGAMCREIGFVRFCLHDVRFVAYFVR